MMAVEIDRRLLAEIDALHEACRDELDRGVHALLTQAVNGGMSDAAALEVTCRIAFDVISSSVAVLMKPGQEATASDVCCRRIKHFLDNLPWGEAREMMARLAAQPPAVVVPS